MSMSLKANSDGSGAIQLGGVDKIAIGTDGVLEIEGMPASYCRAWLQYNAVTNTIVADFNVDTVTDGGTGKCTVNLITAMPSANYSVVADGGWGTTNCGGCISAQSQSTTAIAIWSGSNAGTSYIDYDRLTMAIFK